MVNELLPLQHYRNVIFDIDGTLMDSNDAHAHAFVDALEANGIHHIGFNQIRRLIGMNSQLILHHVLGEAVYVEKGEKIDQDRQCLFAERYLEQIQPFAGVLPLLELMKAHGIRVALSSNSPKSIVLPFLKKLQVNSQIEGYTSAEDSPAGKPDPVAIESCCEKFGFNPQQTLMVGDSPYDIIAAQEFSIPTIGLLSGGYTAEELQKTGAIAVYNNLQEFYQAYQQTVLKRVSEKRP